MTIANPLAWGLLLLAIPIILFFLLKVRFRKEWITTTIFWNKVFEERRNRRLHRRWRYLISLLLALLFIACLTAAVLDPAMFAAQNSRHVLIIDNSASMNALLSESETSRLDAAKQQALKQLNQLSGRQVALLSANIEPQIISGFTNHSGTLRQRLAEIPATDFPAGTHAALQLAEQLIEGSPDASIYIYTDSMEAADGRQQTAAEAETAVKIFPMGESISNVALTRFQPRRLPERATDYEIFIEVINFGTETVETSLEIEREGTLVDILSLSLEPNVPVTRILRNTSAGGGLFRATLTNPDQFLTDNTAAAFLSEQYVQRILLYGEENFFLWHVLQALPLTEVRVIAAIPDVIPPDSVLVLHQTVPPILPLGNVLIIDPQNDSNLLTVGGLLERPMAATVNAESPLVRFIAPGLVFANARTLIPQTHNLFPLLATADEFPLYLQFVADEQRVLVLSADLNQGDFSLRTAFPILISQALSYFRNTEELQKAYSTAEPVRLTLPTEHPQVILRSPSGREAVFPCQNGVVSLGRLGETGIWTILEADTQRELAQIACNLFNAAESNFQSTAEMPVPSGAEAGTFFVRPIWFYLAFFALLLTAMEWFLYQRRWIE